MKKLAVVGVMVLALGATAFARGHRNWNGSEGMHNFLSIIFKSYEF